MPAVLQSLHPAYVHELQVRVVDQRRGVQRRTGGLAAEPSMGHAAQLAVHERHQAIQRFAIAVTPLTQQPR